MPKPWTWKRLEVRERGKPQHATRGWRKPEYRTNARGMIVKDIRQRERIPAVQRFFDHIEYVGECWRYTGSKQFWVTDDVVISPWRFSYEVHNGTLAPKGARFKWKCGNVGCCNPEHIILR